jgi:2,4-dienoyl-CoA reductase-like NADH-dependent reductase (Old Yellow Enzyme family)
MPRELTVAEIHDMVEKFAKAALRIKRSGCDAVETHGAHGYLIAEFMSPYMNKRADLYGGSFENRMRFPLEIIRRTRELVRNDFPIIFRLSADEFVEGGVTLEESKRIAVALEAAGVDAINVSAAFYETMHKYIDEMHYPEGWRVYLSDAIRKVVKIPVMTNGQIKTPSFAEGIFKERKADFIALGRPLIADPYWPQKAEEDRENDIRRCISCNKCISRVSYHLYLGCSINAEVGRGKEFKIEPAEKKGKY